ncbi:unnamed protein product [Cuscuta campestris]|uniref:RRM domain-containing protein n=1 Tax=Cuscuta campestris TaxID=132261 RepID=A0A484NM26_9ASTE|nr:unnamed protein product [Cuscuta campestris]
MGKKSRKARDEDNQEVSPNSGSNPNSSSIFKTLFGEVSEDAAAAALFSDDNPFRRKPASVSQEPPQAELGLASDAYEVKDSESKKRKEKKKNKREESVVSELDNEVGEQDGNRERKKLKNFEPGKHEDIHKENKKKRKRDDIEAEYEVKRYGLQEVAKPESGSGKVGEKRKKMDNPEDVMVSKEGFDDENKLLRTIFVGNVPLKTKKKTLLKEFSKYGEIESLRIRSVPIADTKAPRKAAVLMKNFNENADCVHAYIVFKSEDSAQASLAHNMTVVEGNHIRVDRACPPRKKIKGDSAPLYDNKRTLFVGNLPFDVKDEEIYQLLCGIKTQTQDTIVEAVRVIRDPNTHLGKGFAYVLFKTREAANLVVKKHLKLRDRELRLSHAKGNVTPSKRKNPNDDTNPTPTKWSPGGQRPEKASSSSLSYQGMRANKPTSGQKRSRPKTAGDQPKFKPKSQDRKKRQTKRPAVAARKARELSNAAAAAAGGGHHGTKRKLENRTPSSGKRHTKARKFG